MSTPLYDLLSAWRSQRLHEGVWTEHKDFLVSDWRSEVTNDDTREGYDDWVENQIEQRYYEVNDE